MKEAAQFANKLIQQMRKEEFIRIDEKEYFETAKEFLEREFGANIFIYSGDEECYDPANKRRHAMPYKPAIYIE